MTATAGNDPHTMAVAQIEEALIIGELLGPEAAISRLHHASFPGEGSDAVAALMSFHLGRLYAMVGEPIPALELLNDAHTRYLELDDRLGAASTQAERAVVHGMLDAWADATQDATAALAVLAGGERGPDKASDEERRLRGRRCVTVARVLQDAGRFSLPDEHQPGALQALYRATELLEGTGDEAYAAVAFAHYRHSDPSFLTIPAEMCVRLGLGVQTDHLGRIHAADAGEAGAELLAQRGEAWRAAAVYRDVARVLVGARQRALRLLRRTSDIHRNLGAHPELARDLSEVAALQAAAGQPTEAADTVELGLRAARRSSSPAGAVHALLLSAAQLVADEGDDPLDVWLAGHSERDVTELWGRPPGPAGEIALELAPGLRVWCDVADGSLTRVFQSTPANGGLVGSLLSSAWTQPAPGLLECSVAAGSPLLDALGNMAAVAAAHEHPLSDDPLGQVLLRLQWAAAHRHLALAGVIDTDMVRGAWDDAREAISALDAGDRERLYGLFGADHEDLASAIEQALIHPGARELLDLLEQGLEPFADPSLVSAGGSRGLKAALKKAARAGREMDLERLSQMNPQAFFRPLETKVGADIGAARKMARLAAVSLRRSRDSSSLWSEAATAWKPHSATCRILCEWYGGSGAPDDPGLAFFELQLRRRQPARAMRTWDAHVTRA